ncbi:GAF and ANTAR domain-containing protein [Mycolicibacterium baixiangningiae]|uniref:GAF and ANTAR domain-containing protein n=1 Tax=Mycolicibacterium baixiangningiae TaxID=2761578 RepID=UPI0018683436|nr:GAF and ANTAR domain-containing protein [Mycolicibacterium baixiangningiae]
MTGLSRVDLAQVLGDLAVEMQDQTDAESTLHSIVDGAIAIVPGAQWAGISLIEGRRVKARVPSDPLVVELDELQSSLDEGPCVSALREHRTVHIEDMALESRWPRFSKTAAARGIGSLLSFQLFVHSENLGALNLYGSQPGVFDEESLFVGELLAQHASVALIGAAAESQFRDALSSRDAIGQAKGLLMHRENLTDVEAFALMVQTSQRSNIKLVELARWLIDQHAARLNRA